MASFDNLSQSEVLQNLKDKLPNSVNVQSEPEKEKEVPALDLDPNKKSKKKNPEYNQAYVDVYAEYVANGLKDKSFFDPNPKVIGNQIELFKGVTMSKSAATKLIAAVAKKTPGLEFILRAKNPGEFAVRFHKKNETAAPDKGGVSEENVETPPTPPLPQVERESTVSENSSDYIGNFATYLKERLESDRDGFDYDLAYNPEGEVELSPGTMMSRDAVQEFLAEVAKKLPGMEIIVKDRDGKINVRVQNKTEKESSAETVTQIGVGDYAQWFGQPKKSGKNKDQREPMFDTPQRVVDVSRDKATGNVTHVHFEDVDGGVPIEDVKKEDAPKPEIPASKPPDSLIKLTEQEKEIPKTEVKESGGFKVGDLAQWRSKDFDFPPAKITGFSDNGEFASLEGSGNFVPVSELVAVKPEEEQTPVVNSNVESSAADSEKFNDNFDRGIRELKERLNRDNQPLNTEADEQIPAGTFDDRVPEPPTPPVPPIPENGSGHDNEDSGEDIEPPLDEKRDFSDDDNEGKGFFRRMVDRVSAKAGDIGLNLRSNTADLWMVNAEHLVLSHYDNKSQKIFAELTTVQKERTDLETKIESFKNEVSSMETRFGANAVPNAAKEIQEMQWRLDKIRNKEGVLNHDLDIINDKKLEYQRRRDALAVEVVHAVERRLEPHKDRLEIELNKFNQLGKEVNNFKSDLEEKQRVYDELKVQAGKTAFRTTRQALRLKLKESQKALDLSKSILNQRMREQAAISGKMEKIKKPIADFTEIINKFARISQRLVANTPASEVPLEEVNTDLPNTRGRRLNYAGGTRYAPFGSDAIRNFQEVVKEPKRMTLIELFDSWNKFFASRERLDRRPFEQFLETRGVRKDGRQLMTTKEFTDFARSYFEAMRKEGVTKISEKDLEKTLEKFQKLHETI